LRGKKRKKGGGRGGAWRRVKLKVRCGHQHELCKGKKEWEPHQDARWRWECLFHTLPLNAILSALGGSICTLPDSLRARAGSDRSTPSIPEGAASSASSNQPGGTIQGIEVATYVNANGQWLVVRREDLAWEGGAEEWGRKRIVRSRAKGKAQGSVPNSPYSTSWELCDP
jgi:hypothetical protein